MGLRTTQVDLGAENLIAASKGKSKIAVEIKSFVSPSLLNELEKTIGQMRLYSFALSKRDSRRVLHLAIPLRVFNTLKADPELFEFIRTEKFNLIIYNAQTGGIEQWLEMN